MRTTFNNQRGTIAVLFAILLTVLIGFCALAIDVGSWYVVQAELSKSVDAAAFMGAKNISNPYADPTELAEELGSENFPPGFLGTPVSGAGTATFNAISETGHRIQVNGSVNSRSYLAQLFGFNNVATLNTGVASMNNVEIMLVLDRSGSMSGSPIADLKTAATSFISFFTDTQDQDKVGLISFATGVTVNFPLGNNYVTPMTSAINAMQATGATNAEDALAQVSGPYGLTDQSAVPADQRVQQFVIFFTDGMPTAFRGKFKYKGIDNIDAVVCGTGNTCDQVYYSLGATDSETWLNGNPNSSSNKDPNFTGDGDTPGTCAQKAPGSSTNTPTMKWYVFNTYPVPGYSPQKCYTPGYSLPYGSTNRTVYNNNLTLPHYICSTAKQMALDNAQQLKNNNVMIYTIGLGPQANGNFLTQVASGADFYYYAPDSSGLQAIFNAIAKDIKLRLVQ